jgi:hypothetical protein
MTTFKYAYIYLSIQCKDPDLTGFLHDGGEKNMNGIVKVSRLFAVMVAVAMIAAVPSAVFADYEPNDSISDAEWTYSGEVLTGDVDSSTDQADYYYIFLSSGDTIDITLEGTGGGLDLYLYDDSETLLDASEGGTSDEFITYQATSYDNYYIQVWASSGSGSYTLTTDVSSGYVPPIGNGGAYFVGGPDYVDGQPLATLPTLNVGDSAYFGGVKDIGEEFKPQIDEALEEIEGYGIDVKYDISGGAGAFFGWEIASNNADIDGNTCYDIALMGAVAIDIGIEGSVDGDIEEGGYSISVDGSADGFVTFEATLDGHLYLTVDELAIAKLTLTLTAEGEFELNADVSASMGVESMDADISASGAIEDAEMNFQLTFDPPLDIFQFGTGSGSTEGIYEGKQWYVPGEDTLAEGSVTASGTVTYDVQATITGEDPVNEADTINIGDEVGNPTFSETIPGGESDDWYGGGGVMFECTHAAGNIFIIETAMGDAFGMIGTDLPFPGTRQFSDPTEMMPMTGLQLQKDGLVTGMTMGGEAMTETATKAEVESFSEDPLGEVTAETGGHSGGLGSMLIIILVVVVVIVVVVVVLMVVMRKKTPPPQQYPPQQPMYGPQPGYEQPPPQYQPQQQYPPQQGQYPPPPPPPPGQ